MSTSLGSSNPLRYRGYVYDSESGFYYLQSRYYNPEWGRFINADDTAYLGVDGTPLSYNLFAYCSNNPVMDYDPTGEFGVFGLMVIGAIVSATIEYASQVIKHYRSGETGAKAWMPSDIGKIASSAFSGAISAIPGGGILATAADLIGSAVIEHGVNSLCNGTTWSWSDFGNSIANNITSTVISSNFKLADDVPKYLRHIKDEAREIGIKGTRKLTRYLNIKQVIVIGKNSFNSAWLSELTGR